MIQTSLANYVGKGIERLEYIFEQKGVLCNGMTLQFHLRDQSNEELFELLASVDRIYEKLKTPYEVMLAGIWRQIQVSMNRHERGHLLRRTFGELRAKQMMHKLSIISRVVKYWEGIEEPMEFGIPFWIYEECSRQDLPGMRAIERVAQFKRQNSNTTVRLTRNEIRAEGEQLKETRKISMNGKGSEPHNVSHIKVKDSMEIDSVVRDSSIIAVATKAIQPEPAFVSRRQELETLWTVADKPPPPRPNKTLVADLPAETYDGLDLIARAFNLSPVQLLIKLVDEAMVNLKLKEIVVDG